MRKLSGFLGKIFSCEEEKVKKIVRSPSSRNRTSDLRITTVHSLQSSALPTELSKAPLLRAAAAVPLILTKAILQDLKSFEEPRLLRLHRTEEPGDRNASKGRCQRTRFPAWTKETQTTQAPSVSVLFTKRQPPTLHPRWLLQDCGRLETRPPALTSTPDFSSLASMPTCSTLARRRPGLQSRRLTFVISAPCFPPLSPRAPI